MPLTRQEMEAKLAALENRVTLLGQAVDGLEDRFQEAAEQWMDWALVLQSLSEIINRRMEQIQKKVQ